MKVLLAGMNVDYGKLCEMKDIVREASNDTGDSAQRLQCFIESDSLTPETISAAYARISRSPLRVDQLRKKAVEDVHKARKSNESIVFDMGHSSVAEHAVFNIDIIGLSRLATEFLQEHRVVSFTEKSQRYVKLDEDFIVPAELEDEAGLRKRFIETVHELNITYDKLYTRLFDHFSSLHTDLSENDISGMAKEDARYVLPLATTTQMGMTVNARSAEYIIKKLASVPLLEAQFLSRQLYDILQPVAPSLIRYTEPSDYDFRKWQNIYDVELQENTIKTPVTVINHTADGEKSVITALLYRNRSVTYETLLNSLKKAELPSLLAEEWKGINFYDSMDRAFEMADVTLELVMSASCYAQLKRHRMSTIIPGMYDCTLGTVMPDSIQECDMTDVFAEAIEKTEELAGDIAFLDGPVSSYALTNAHKRRVIMKANIREWYHFVRLRSDKHAQWEIRRLSHAIETELKRIYPLLTAIMMGKDAFAGAQVQHGKKGK